MSWVAAAVNGIRVVESDRLPYDEMYVAAQGAAVVVGEASHFKWRMEMINENHRVRSAAADHIRKEAERILGEPWTLASD